MENTNEPFANRLRRKDCEDRLTIIIERDDVTCDATFTALVDAALKRVLRDCPRVVEFDMAAHRTLGSGVLAQLLRLRHHPVDIEIRNASPDVVTQLEVTRIDTVIRVRRD